MVCRVVLNSRAMALALTVAGTKRDSHLALSLERLDALLEKPAQRIGLSATVRPVERVTEFLGSERPVTVVAPPSSRNLDVRIVVPVEDMSNIPEHEPGENAGNGRPGSNGNVTDVVRQLVSGSVDAALELVGCGVLHDTMKAVRVHGTVCFTGALGDQWTIPDFDPFSMIPFGVRLTSYGGQASDLPANVFNRLLLDIAEGRMKVNIGKVFHGLEGVREAHADLESGKTPGKQVVVLP